MSERTGADAVVGWLATNIALAGVSLLIAATVFLHGLAVALLWQWFVVPAFGLPALGVVPAMGLKLLWATLGGYRTPPAKEDDQSATRLWLWSGFGFPVMLVALGWLLSWLM